MNWDQIISDALKIGIPSVVTIVVLILSNVYMAKRQKNDLVYQEHKHLREKREQLTTALFAYSAGMRDYFVNLHNFWAGEGDRDSLNEEIKKKIPQQQESEIQIRMLITLYFPELQPAWDQFYTDKNDFSKKIHGYVGYEVPPLSKEKLAEIRERNDRFGAGIRHLASNLAALKFESVSVPAKRDKNEL